MFIFFLTFFAILFFACLSIYSRIFLDMVPCLCVSLIILFLVFILHQKRVSDLIVAIDSGYDIYINGQPVSVEYDADYLNEGYRIYIDHDNHTILCD